MGSYVRIPLYYIKQFHFFKSKHDLASPLAIKIENKYLYNVTIPSAVIVSFEIRKNTLHSAFMPHLTFIKEISKAIVQNPVPSVLSGVRPYLLIFIT